MTHIILCLLLQVKKLFMLKSLLMSTVYSVRTKTTGHRHNMFSKWYYEGNLLIGFDRSLNLKKINIKPNLHVTFIWLYIV